jgi:hypothetical protein
MSYIVDCWIRDAGVAGASRHSGPRHVGTEFAISLRRLHATKPAPNMLDGMSNYVFQRILVALVVEKICSL